MVEGPLNITITTEADDICQNLKDSGFFQHKKDAYVYAMLLALHLKLEVDDSIRPTKNSWDTTAVFQSKDNDIYAIFEVLGVQNKDMVQYGKQLAEAGLRYINKGMQENKDLLSILLG